MELSFGAARSGIGGGISQISNSIHWWFSIQNFN
ncbi:hypothetical protein [Snodgrassella sp. B3882]